MTKILNIIFMGTPDFAAVALKALIESPHNVTAVYSQPPRPKGRGHKIQKSSVHMLGEEHGIAVYTPKSLKSLEAQEQFAANEADIAIVAAYGLLLPEAILNTPKYGCLNIHASLLPRWRGASPIQHAIWKGDDKTGVTIMQMDKGLDTGDMILKCELAITAETTASNLHDKLADMGAELTLQVLSALPPTSEKQDDAQSTYAPLLKKTDGNIDWSETAQQIERKIRSLNPWPGVWANIQGKRFKILDASPSKPTKRTIACGQDTYLEITTLQPEGKKPMDLDSAINGGYLESGSINDPL